MLQSMELQRAGHDLMTEQTKINLGGAVVKNLPANANDMGLIPGLGQSPGEGNDGPLQFSCLGNPTDRGAWQSTAHGVTRSWT